MDVVSTYTGKDSNGNSIVGDNDAYDYYTYRLQYAASKTWSVTVRVAKGGYKYIESSDVRLYSTNGYKTPPTNSTDSDLRLDSLNSEVGSCEFELANSVGSLMELADISSSDMSFMVYNDIKSTDLTSITGTAFYVYEDNSKLYVQYKSK